MLLTEFFKNDFVNYASYDNLRKIASYIDGQKNASRKVLYTVLEKNIKDKIKVSQLGSKVAEFAEYLHGNLDNVIVNLAQDFSGTNNLPLLQKKGNFGTRFAQEASASRYIFTYGSENFFKIFKKEDCNILVKQTFEGSNIEPLFYVPTLPLILINGSEGVSSGFAQKILPRNPKSIQKYILDYLSGKSPNAKLLEPYFNNFNGSIEKGENPNQWLIKGKIKRINQTTIVIDEIPVGYDLKSYIKVLDALEDSKVINSYKDLSDNDIFKFEVKMLSKELDRLSETEILTKLKLVKTVTENFTCIDENSKIVVFDDAKKLIDNYINIKLKFLNLRKDYLIQQLDLSLQIIKSKLTFIKKILSEELKINKRAKDSIIKDIEKIKEITKINDNYDYLLNMPLYSLTKDKLANLVDDYKKQTENLKSLKSKSINDLWIEDLN